MTDPKNEGTEVAYQAPAGAHYGQHHLDRYAHVGADNAEVGALASEIDGLPADERDAFLNRLSSISNADLKKELDRRRTAADSGRDPAEVTGETGAPDDEGGDGGGGQGDGGEVDLSKPEKHTVKVLLAEVGDDKDKARALIEAEEARGDEARTTLLEKLDEIAGDSPKS